LTSRGADTRWACGDNAGIRRRERLDGPRPRPDPRGAAADNPPTCSPPGGTGQQEATGPAGCFNTVMGWASFLESVGVTIVAAFLTACWHVLARNEKSEAQELAIGIDLVVATMVLLSGFLPDSAGSEVAVRWAGLVVLFAMLTAMAVFTKMFGYKPDSPLYRRDESGNRRKYIEVDRERMTGTAAWTTSIAGSVVLGACWWLNLNIGLVVAAWKGAFH
jgi:hypothetical protein